MTVVGERLPKRPPAHHGLTALIRSHWDRRAVSFDGDSDHGLVSEAQRRAWRDVLASVVGEPPRQVLDAGCGTGSLTILLAELGHTVTGVDMAPRMLERARQKGEAAALSLRLRLEDVTALGDADGSYDVVVARHVVWTLPDPEQAIREWFRILRPGGCLAIIEGRWSLDRPAAPLRQGMVGALQRVAGRLIFYGVRPAQWGAVLGRVVSRASVRLRWKGTTAQERSAPADQSAYLEQQYAKEHVKLPFYGGPSSAELIALLERQGFRSVTLIPLMEAVLWGEAPKNPRYLAVARR